jgi:hypothetical protein
MPNFAMPSDATCGICLETVIDPYVLDCEHTFCRGCIKEYKKRGINDLCPYCRAPLPPGAAECVDGCIKMGARIARYEAAEGNTRRIEIAEKCQLHYARKAVSADPNNVPARLYLAYGLSRNGIRHGARIAARASALSWFWFEPDNEPGKPGIGRYN